MHFTAEEWKASMDGKWELDDIMMELLCRRHLNHFEMSNLSSFSQLNVKRLLSKSDVPVRAGQVGRETSGITDGQIYTLQSSPSLPLDNLNAKNMRREDVKSVAPDSFVCIWGAPVMSWRNVPGSDYKVDSSTQIETTSNMCTYCTLQGEAPARRDWRTDP